MVFDSSVSPQTLMLLRVVTFRGYDMGHWWVGDSPPQEPLQGLFHFEWHLRLEPYSTTTKRLPFGEVTWKLNIIILDR